MFRTVFAIILLIAFVALQGCYKEIIYDENPFLVRKQALDFKGLETSGSSLFPGDTLFITAVAIGDELNYNWHSDSGILTYDGNKAFFISDVAGEYQVYCDITDKYGNHSSKTVLVNVAVELIFETINTSDTLIPLNHTTQLNALASGDGLSYNWTSSGGNLIFDKEVALFYASTTGKYVLTCVVTDKNGNQITRSLIVEVAPSFIYKNLTAAQDSIVAGNYTEITADVLGANLKYDWKSNPPANIVGEGNVVLFTICHADIFEVSCKVSDQFGNYEIKSILIKVTN